MDERFSRQEALPVVGKVGQELISAAKATIIGLGALGSHAAELLLRAGVRRLTLIDDDTVELSNLQRQALYTEADIGKPKVIAAKTHLEAIDKDAAIMIHDQRLGDFDAERLQGIVLDCTDSIDSRKVIDHLCAERSLHWVHGAVVGKFGEVMVFLSGAKGYTNFFKDKDTPESCRDAGVFNHAVTMVAAIQVGETMKLILGIPTTEKMIRINAMDMTIDHISVTDTQPEGLLGAATGSLHTG